MQPSNLGVTGRVDSSLVLGGPIYRLLVRSHLEGPSLEFPLRRILAAVLIVWAPLLVLSSLGGTLVGGPGVPFLHDPSTQARFLISLPLMIEGERFVHLYVGVAVQQFIDRGLIEPEGIPRFESALASLRRARESATAEIVLAVIVVSIGHWAWARFVQPPVPMWYFAEIGGQRRLTLAGFWYVFISLPIFRFFLYRWYYRIILWYRLLWQISRLPLRLNALHPDRAGGLGFLSMTTIAFAPLLLAHTVFMSGLIGGRIWHEQRKLAEFKVEIAALIIGLIALVHLPLLFLSVQLVPARRAGLIRYGLFAQRYVDDFRRRWYSMPEGEPRESPLGSGDIQSLADLANSYQVVRGMQVAPFDARSILWFAILLLVPIAPLTLTVIPLDQIIDRLLRIAV